MAWPPFSPSQLLGVKLWKEAMTTMEVAPDAEDKTLRFFCDKACPNATFPPPPLVHGLLYEYYTFIYLFITEIYVSSKSLLWTPTDLHLFSQAAPGNLFPALKLRCGKLKMAHSAPPLHLLVLQSCS
ncbi:UNVERIFIED_CONTAM: hypothetical protein K2H54_038058 [Gekko kuhli]